MDTKLKLGIGALIGTCFLLAMAITLLLRPEILSLVETNIFTVLILLIGIGTVICNIFLMIKTEE